MRTRSAYLCRLDVMLVASTTWWRYFAAFVILTVLLMPPSINCFSSQNNFGNNDSSDSSFNQLPSSGASAYEVAPDSSTDSISALDRLLRNRKERKQASKLQEASFVERLIQKHRKRHSARAKKRALVKRDLINRPTSFQQLIARYVGPMNNDIRGLRPITAIQRGNYLTNQQVSHLLSDGMGNQKSVAEQPFKVLYHRHSGQMLSVHPDGTVFSSGVENRLCKYEYVYLQTPDVSGWRERGGKWISLSSV